jgi:hypothetical protein
MEIQKIKETRDQLAKQIAKLIEDYEWETDIVVADSVKISRGQDELNPRRLVIGLTIIVPE